jgi:hypothetical protein
MEKIISTICFVSTAIQCAAFQVVASTWLPIHVVVWSFLPSLFCSFNYHKLGFIALHITYHYQNSRFFYLPFFYLPFFQLPFWNARRMQSSYLYSIYMKKIAILLMLYTRAVIYGNGKKQKNITYCFWWLVSTLPD